MHENSQNSKLISLFPAQKKETSGNFVVSFGGWDLLRRRLFRGPSEQLNVRKKNKKRHFRLAFEGSKLYTNTY